MYLPYLPSCSLGFVSPSKTTPKYALRKLIVNK